MSPEQISKRLKQEQFDHAVSHEWIYRFIATDKHCDGALYLYLQHRRKRYQKRYGSHDLRVQLRNRVSLTERPVEVETRERLGGGDTVHGVGGNLVILVDRKSGYLSAYSGPVRRRTRRQVTRAINISTRGMWYTR